MRCFARHGLAYQFGLFWVAAGVSDVLWDLRRPVGGIHSGDRGPEGRFEDFGRASTFDHPGRQRDDGFGQRRPHFLGAGRAVGVGLQIGEAKATCRRWTGPDILDRPRSLGYTCGSTGTTNGGHRESDEGTREEAEVCQHSGSGRRFGIHGGERDAEAGVVADICQLDRRPTHGAGGAHDGATFGSAQKVDFEAVPLCRLRSFPPLWKEGTSCPKIQDLRHDTEWLLHEGTAGAQWHRPVASLVQGLSHCAVDAAGHHDVDGGGVRGLHREDGPPVQGLLAPHGAGRRAGEVGAHAQVEGVDRDGHHHGREGASDVERGQPLGGPIQKASQGFRLLGRTSPPAGQCMVGPWLQRQAPHAVGGHCRVQHPRGLCGAEARRGGDEEHPRAMEEVGKRQTERSKEKKVARGGGEEHRHEGKRKGERKREGPGMLCMEQQQWGLCWTPSRICLPRKRRKRTQMHSLRFTGTPLTSMLTERRLIVELKRDWKKSARRHNWTQGNFQVPYFAWGTSRSRGREDKAYEKEDDEKKENKQSPHKRRRTTKDPDNDDEPKAEFNGKLMTVDVYTMKRRFNFLHMYAGKKDPLGEAIKRQAKAHRMKVTVISCEKENGVDLLAEEPYLEFLEKAKEGFWDGMHSGFPCTSFSRLRWREAKGYPGPVRSKRHPYGIPGIPRHRQQEADEGTLHASRTAHMADRIISSRPEDRLRPFATLENPPPTDHGEHLSAWELPEIANLFEKYEQDFILAEFPTCIYQPHLDFGLRTFKPQMFGGTLPGLSSLRGKCRCGDEPHVPVV